MLLSIVIVNYNTFELTCDCIRSIQQSTNLQYEIILIDNNSRDRSPEEFLNLFPAINLVCLKKNVGFGRANNIGVERAMGKYVLLLNSDTIVHSNTINDTVDYLEKHKNIDILGCRVMLSDDTIQPTVLPYNGESNLIKTAVILTKRNAVIKEVLKSIHKLLYSKNQGQTTEGGITKADIIPNYYCGKRIGKLAGVFLLMKREVYLETKGFDPDFFMYYEELEWFVNRLNRYNIVYYPSATITHFYGKSDVYGNMSLNGHLSHYLFWYKMSYLHFVLFFFYNLIEIPSKIIVGIVQLKKIHFQQISVLLKAFPYVLWDIPRYSNKYGARKQMLQTNTLRKSEL